MAINWNILVDWTGAYTTQGQLIADSTTRAGELTASSQISTFNFGLTWIENNLALFLLIMFFGALVAYAMFKKRAVMR